MPLQIVHQDITAMKCDVIVNPTDCFFSGSGGTDRAIHRAAGKELDGICEKLDPIGFGEVAMTPAFNLPGKFILHTMGPVWKGGAENEAVLLRSCYVNALIKAKKLGALSVAFPLISAGTFGFPKERVLRIAIDAVSDFLFMTDSDMAVYICVLDRNAFLLRENSELKEYLKGRGILYEPDALQEDHSRFEQALSDYAGSASEREDSIRPDLAWADSIQPDSARSDSIRPDFAQEPFIEECVVCAAAPGFKPESEQKQQTAQHKPSTQRKSTALGKKQKKSQSSVLKDIELYDEGFAELLFRLIDEKGMDDVECYKKANLHRNTFYKIKNNPKYKPSKATVVAFAVALELTMEETDTLLRSAGFALSGNNYFDVIVGYYILRGQYDIFEINSALFQYDQICLGSF